MGKNMSMNDIDKVLDARGADLDGTRDAAPDAPDMDAADAAFRHLYASGAAAQFAPLLDPVAEACGYRLVRLSARGSGRHAALQVMAERADQQGFSHADCARLLRALEAALTADEARADSAALEVSSPGVARPLTRAQDFNAWQGHQVRVRLTDAAPHEGSRLREGILLGFADGVVRVRTSEDAAPLAIAPEEIRAAELVPNMDELRQSLRDAKQAQRTRQLA